MRKLIAPIVAALLPPAVAAPALGAAPPGRPGHEGQPGTPGS